MTNGPDYYAGYPGYGAATGPYSSSTGGKRAGARGRPLWLATAVLGVVVLGVSFGSPVLLGWPVRFSVAAAVVAAVGLLPRQSSRAWIVVTLAAVGFVDALTTWVAADDGGWALVTIVVLTALQTVIAVVALLVESGTVAAGERDDEGDYYAYANYVQAYQAAYASQYQQPPPRSEAGQATAQAQSAASARAQQSPGARGDMARESYAAMQDSYAQYGYGGPPHAGGQAGPPPSARAADPGMPGAGRSSAPTQQTPGQAAAPGETSSS